MTRSDKAVELFSKGYNCAQAVFCAFNDLVGMDDETAFKVSSAFGGGMARMRQVCGAVSGMALAVGMKSGTSESTQEAKAEVYALMQELAKAFKQANGSIVCGELLQLPRTEVMESPVPEARTEAYYHRRPCAEYVRSAATILENKLFKD